MKKLFMYLMILLTVAFVVPAFAGTGNSLPSGPHYNLNIIGVENSKDSTMTDSNRHTIFVALGKNGGVLSNIFLLPSSADNMFRVCDGNGFDQAYDCEGNKLSYSFPGGGYKTGAVFTLPCDTYTEAGTVQTCADAGVYSASYQIFVRELGKPYNGATMTLCAYDTLGEIYCNTGADVVSLYRDKGKPKVQDVTTALTVLNANGERVEIFTHDLVDWVWQYYNNGLKLAQLRFYLVPEPE